MRELKFRAWDAERKRFFTYPKWVEFIVNSEGALSAKNFGFNGKEKSLIVSQYTGLKDENGVEIYEGDYLRAGEDSFVGEVFFDAKSACYKVKAYYKGVKNCHMTLKKFIESRSKAVLSHCLVVGNIYEHPYFLESEHKE